MGKWIRRVVRHMGLTFVAAGGVLTGFSCGGGDVTAPTTGTIEITTATSGPEPDADGYAVSIDDGAETPLGVNATVQHDDLDPGTHSVRLTGMAANCSVEGQNPRTIAVTGDAMAQVGFAITCRATTGSLEVTAATSGPSPDPDGYTITLDGTDRGTLGVTGPVTMEGLTPGSHAVGLSGIAANCQVQGDNPQTATVTAGASTTVTFAITCTAPPPSSGTLRITTSTTGPDPDGNGYAFAVDGGTSQPIAVSTTATLANVAAGAHTVRLSGVASNCSVQGTNPRSVTVSGGATADVTFAVTCSASTGSLEITTTTTGGAPDQDGYTVAVDNASPLPIAGTATLPVPGVSPGVHQITLGGLATNCRVDGDNPRSVTVVPGATNTVAFNVNCGPRIAFVSTRDASASAPYNPDVYLMNADGKGVTRLTNTPEAEYGPAWSPDGTRIAFSRDGDIYVMNADGSGQTRLTNSASAGSPTWSPDGTKIAFVRPDGDYPDLYQEIAIMNADGTGAVPLSSSGNVGNYSSPDWSRDGSRIAFADSYEDTPDWIGVINADGSGEREINDDDECAHGPAWSTDGRIAFSSTIYGEVEGRDHPQCLPGSAISVTNPDGSGVIQLTHNSDNDFLPAWSRDDRKIAFVSYRDGNSEIYIMNADGSGQTRITNHPARDSDPSWSP